MTQLKYPNRPITKPQIKKIHTLVSILNMPDEHYRALLMRFNVESSIELNRSDAVDIIEILTSFVSKISSSPTPLYTRDTIFIDEPLLDKQIGTGVSKNRLVYFNRSGKATDNQLNYIAGLWLQLSDLQTYESLLFFIKKITGVLYMFIECLSIKEASGVIVVLEKWNKQKEIGK